MKYKSGNKDLGDNPVNTLISEIALAIAMVIEDTLIEKGHEETMKLAKDTGRLRKTIESDLIQQIAAQSGSTDVIIVLDRYKLNSITDYITHHWERPPYKNPTTEGTIPIDPVQIMRTLSTHVRYRLKEQFQRQNFKVTTS